MTEIKTAAAWGQIWNDDAAQHAGVLIPRARGVKRHVDTRNEPTLTRVVPVVIVHGLTESEVHEAAGLLAKSREVCEWRTIETAPKDGTKIIVWFKLHGAITVMWTDADGDPTSEYAHWFIDDHKHGPYPVRGYSTGDDTHWMPTPPAPAGAVAAAK